MTLGQRLRWLRKRKGMNGPELAATIGLTGSNLLMWETGKTIIKTGELVRVCAVLGVSVEKILEGIPADAFAPTPATIRARTKAGIARSKTMQERGSMKKRSAKKKKGG
jgi:transcriptional regulator with XRE-family HTH domain